MSEPIKSWIASDEEQKLEAKLAEIQKQREAHFAAREASKREAKLKAEIAKQERKASDDLKYAELEDKYGFESIGRIDTPEGMVVAKAPDALTYRRLTNKMGLTEAQNAKLRTAFFDTAEEAARSCVVYPDRTTYLALAEKYPSLVPAVMTLAIKIGKVEADEAEEK